MIDAELGELRVLLVDDDLVDRMAVVRALAALESGVLVTEVTSASAALDVLRSAPFDCVLSDLHMPGRDGAWLLAQMTAQGFDVPVVVLTGQGDEQTAVALMKAGAADYVNKASASSIRLANVLHHAVRVHRAEREARRAQERLALALGATRLGTWDFDPQTNEVTFDARAGEIYGIAPGVVRFDGSLPSIHPDDRTEAREAMARATVPGSDGHFATELRLVGPGATCVRVTGQVFFVDGRPTRLVGTVEDVTEARRRRAFEQQLIGIVSHDLRNPISAMIMGAQVLRGSVPADSPLSSTIRRILSSGDRAIRLIRDLLDFTQATTGSGIPVKPRPADIHVICHQTVDELSMNHPGRRITHEPRGDGEGQWDPDRMGQVVGNLVRNALTYSPAGSPIAVRSIGGDGLVRIEVHNEIDGAPISDEVQLSLFQPFHRGDGRQDAEGIGLGLFIVSEIVVAHGGGVRVDSTREGGTTFAVELPRPCLP